MSHYSADIKQAENSIAKYFQRIEIEIQRSRINAFLQAFELGYKFFTDGHFQNPKLSQYIDGEIRLYFQKTKDVLEEEKRYEEVRQRVIVRYPSAKKRINEKLPEVMGELLGYTISTFNVEVPLEVYLDPKLQYTVASVLEFIKSEVPEFVPNLQTAVQRRMKEPETSMEMEKWQKDVRLKLDMFMVKVYRILG